ncbi:MAG: multidrug efflux pump subunit AcrB [Parasphingorhabdus sp.]|jgi:multidrug efflux pump subunit AcrB
MKSLTKAGGGIAAWSVHHPIGVVMIAAAVAAIGLFSFLRLSVDLLPHIIYPEIRVRVLDPGVPAKIMQDQITRQVEEQLAITEDAIAVQSRTSEGSTSVDLSFPYGKDIDIALRDASTRLDRAKRFLPESINPPIIFKFDPAQIPSAEYVISSPLRDSVSLRDWVEFEFSRWFLNLPGVAAVEVGGGVPREIHIEPDPVRLASLGLDITDLISLLRAENVESPAGRLTTDSSEYSSRMSARLSSLKQVRELPLRLNTGRIVRLENVAEVFDSAADERIKVRLDGIPGIKISIQKQPTANTVAVVDAVNQRLDWLRNSRQLPDDISIHLVSDQSVFVRDALKNAATAGLTGALLAMFVVYIFLGNLRRTLIVGSAIPLSILVTFFLMDMTGLSLNIMTLGGLAVGIGMVVDSTVVMLENIYRHQSQGEGSLQAAGNAAIEVNGPIIASTSTNLAAILPFLLVSGLVGLLFRELIITISAAIFSAMIVALALVPPLAARVPVAARSGILRRAVDAFISLLQKGYHALVTFLLGYSSIQALVVLAFCTGLVLALPSFTTGKQIFLPKLDDSQVRVRIVADSGITVAQMDKIVNRLEKLISDQPEVESIFALVGGRIFGRTQRETSNQSSLRIQLKPVTERRQSNDVWARKMNAIAQKQSMAGVQMRFYTRGVRGIRIGRGEDDVSLRISGPDQETLAELARLLSKKLTGLDGIRNVTHSAEEVRQELSITPDRERIARYGLTADQVAEVLRAALQGIVVTDFLEGGRSHPIRLRLSRKQLDSISKLESLIISAGDDGEGNVYLSDLAHIDLIAAPAEIQRDNQALIVEISASLSGEFTIGQIKQDVDSMLANFPLPQGYTVYDAGAFSALKDGQNLTLLLLGLALFLVFVVMAVQYESLKNPLVILISVPFSAIGVALGLNYTALPLSMPVWLGIIMLAGIVVNNAIILVETIELLRQRGLPLRIAIAGAARIRLRPILMTSLTTVMGLMPLALALGDGAEMLQPLAVTIVSGLSFSILVSLILVPVVYYNLHGGQRFARSIAEKNPPHAV